MVPKTPPSDLELAALVPDPRVLQAHLGLHRVDLLVGAHDLRDHQITGADLLQPRRLRVGALLLVRLRQDHTTRPLAPTYGLHTVLLKVASCNTASRDL